MKRSSFIVLFSLAAILLFTPIHAQKKKPARAAVPVPPNGQSITPAGWKRHVYPELQFSVAAPAASADGGVYPGFLSSTGQVSFIDGDVEYIASYSDYTLFPDKADAGRLYEDFLETVQTSYKGEKRTLKPIVHNGVKGYEFEYDMVDAVLKSQSEISGIDIDLGSTAIRQRNRYFLVGTKLIGLIAVIDRRMISSRQIAQVNRRVNLFFNSLEFLENPEINNYGVLDDNLYTNKNLGFSITFKDPAAGALRWKFRKYNSLTPFAYSKDTERVGFAPVIEKDGTALLFPAEVSSSGGVKKCGLDLRLVRASSGASVKDVTLAEQARVSKTLGAGSTVGDVECSSYGGQSGCNFKAAKFPDSKDEDNYNDGKANYLRYFVIKLSDTAFLRIDWMAKERGLVGLIDASIESFKIIK